jgi:hypothetical protein
MAEADVQYSGAILTGETEGPMNEITSGIEEALAAKGVKLIQDDFSKVLKHPTGHLSSSVKAIQGEPTRITDGGVVYGAWIEGVSRRNDTSRFKGYATFRRMSQALEEQAAEIAEQVVSQHVGDL